MKINNIQDLIAELGKETVDNLFMEYLLIQKAKADNFDKLSEKIDVLKYLDNDLDTEFYMQ